VAEVTLIPLYAEEDANLIANEGMGAPIMVEASADDTIGLDKATSVGEDLLRIEGHAKSRSPCL
jgi:hypothetical protein